MLSLQMFTWLPLERSSPTEFSASIYMWKITYSITFSAMYIHVNKGFYSTSSLLGSLAEIHQNSPIKLGLLSVSLSCTHQVPKMTCLLLAYYYYCKHTCTLMELSNSIL